LTFQLKGEPWHLRAELAYQDQAPLGIEWNAQPAAAPEPTAAVRTAATFPVTPPSASPTHKEMTRGIMVAIPANFSTL